jgi:hypothetical protein
VAKGNTVPTQLPRRTIGALVVGGVAVAGGGLFVAPVLSLIGVALIFSVPFVILLAVARDRPKPARSAMTDQMPLVFIRGVEVRDDERESRTVRDDR